MLLRVVGVDQELGNPVVVGDGVLVSDPGGLGLLDGSRAHGLERPWRQRPDGVRRFVAVQLGQVQPGCVEDGSHALDGFVDKHAHRTWGARSRTAPRTALGDQQLPLAR